MDVSERQEWLDRFYFTHGPCCAGCDWWRSLSSQIGECRRSAPTMSSTDGLQLMGIDWCSRDFGAGHMITNKDHHCGDFKDGFDWSSLPLPYRKRVGAPI